MQSHTYLQGTSERKKEQQNTTIELNWIELYWIMVIIVMWKNFIFHTSFFLFIWLHSVLFFRCSIVLFFFVLRISPKLSFNLIHFLSFNNSRTFPFRFKETQNVYGHFSDSLEFRLEKFKWPIYLMDWMEFHIDRLKRELTSQNYWMVWDENLIEF